MEELQKRLTKIEHDANAFRTATEAFGKDEEVLIYVHFAPIFIHYL